MIITKNRPATHHDRELLYAFTYSTPDRIGNCGLVLIDHSIDGDDDYNVHLGELPDDASVQWAVPFLCTSDRSAAAQYRDGGTTIIASPWGSVFIPSTFASGLKAQMQLIDTEVGFMPIIELEPLDPALITITARRTAPGNIVVRRLTTLD